MTETRLRQHIIGSLVASAIGNILGRPAENQHYARVTERFGLLDEPFSTTNSASLHGDLGTDENALMLILCNTYGEKRGRVTIEDEARTWLREVNPLDFGDGHQRHRVNSDWYILRNTYELLTMGCPPRMVGAFTVPANTGLVVVGPTATFNACDPDQAYLDAVSLASLFQRERGVLVPGVMAGAVAEALRPGATIDSVVETALRLAPSVPLITAVRRRMSSLREALLEGVHIGQKYSDPLALRPEAYQRLTMEGSIANDPQAMLALAFAFFVAAGGNTKMALIGGANMGHDADTLAGMLGLLCGAMNGIESLPQDWRDGFGRLPGAAAFMSAADDMAALALARAENQASVAREILAAAQQRGSPCATPLDR